MLETSVFTRLRAAIIWLSLVVPVVTAAANPSWTATLGVDVWNLPELREKEKAAAEKDQALETAQAEIRLRIDTKEALVGDLLARRRGLEDVATQFLVLNEGYEELLFVIRQIYPGASDEEKMLWNVIDFAQSRMAYLPSWQRLGIMTQLHSELLARSAELAATPSN
jgi:hypothetical protein